MTADEIAKLPTPLTDDAEEYSDDARRYFVSGDFARRMEQDRAALMEALEGMLKAQVSAWDAAVAQRTLAAVRERGKRDQSRR